MDIQDQINKAKELDAAGIEAAGAGDVEKAVKIFESAAEIYEGMGDSINRASNLFRLANCYHLLKKNTLALDAYKKVYNIVKGNEKLVEYQAMILNNLGHLYVSIKDYDNALKSFEKSFENYETLKNENGRALQIQNIGSVHRDLKESEQALEAYFKSIAIFEKIENRIGEADQCTNIAYIYARDNNISEALKWYKRAFVIYSDINEDKKAALTEKNIKKLEE